MAGRAEALSHLEEAQFRHFQMEREVAELRQALGRAKEEVAALKMANTVRRPPSRGAAQCGGGGTGSGQRLLSNIRQWTRLQKEAARFWDVKLCVLAWVLQARTAQGGAASR